MLKTIYRLPLQKEGKQLFQEGQTLYTPLFKIIKKDNQNKRMRFGFIVNKKIDKRAVIRNYVKRKLREAASKYVNTTPPRDLLIIANKKTIKAPLKDIEKTLEKIIDQN